jgi:hypothetical protein
MKHVCIVVNKLGRFIRALAGKPPRQESFPGSQEYWEQRYIFGGHSGVGSYEKFAHFKAEIVNAFVSKHGINTIIELGCGDGNQLSFANYPNYIGFDVSRHAVEICMKRFASDKSKLFKLMEDYDGEVADLSLSLDVIYHLIENDAFERYMRNLFASSHQYVIIYSSDSTENEGYEGTHVKHRKFSEWISKNLPQWTLIERIQNKYPYDGDYRTGSFSDFYIYGKAR